MAAYALGESQVIDLQLRIHRSSLPDEVKARRLGDLNAIRTQLSGERESMARTFEVARKAQASIPKRLWPGSAWNDPITGASFPVNMSREAMAEALASRHLQGDEFKSYLHLVGAVSRPGAEPMPSLATILEGR